MARRYTYAYDLDYSEKGLREAGLQQLRDAYKDIHWSKLAPSIPYHGEDAIVYDGIPHSPAYVRSMEIQKDREAKIVAELERRGHQPPRGF
jgi:hypothetical protein